MSREPLPAPSSSVTTHRPETVSPRIDDPMALLRSCHEKVVRFTTLAQRLRTHIRTHGVDDQAMEAARAVLRYFTLAAPLHHADEEDNLFVALRSLQQPALTARIDALHAEHVALGDRWGNLRPWLEAIAAGQVPTEPEPDVDGFATHYRAHAQAEETEVYPHAAKLSPQELQNLADAMVARRQHPAAD